MSLIDLWQSAPDELKAKHVQQVIAFAGAGRLRDGSSASLDFRSFLARVPASMIRRYAEECLASKFEDAPFALQDLVNEVGRRLGFSVDDGRYRGSVDGIGFDGIWSSAANHRIVVEVKTSDVFTIDLDVIAGYRTALIESQRLGVDDSSTLVIVGRQDTGALEAQIRGSRHAWDMRLISVDSLLRLLAVKESVEDPTTDRQISEVLVPREYTRVDKIIDLVFAATSEASEEPIDDTGGDDEAPLTSGKKFTPVNFHVASADRIASALNVTFLRKSKATFASPDGNTIVICAISREYGEEGSHGYWFAFHPHQKSTLSGAKRGFVAFACGSAEKILLIPYPEFLPFLPSLNVTEQADRSYWHVQIFDEGHRLVLRPKSGNERVDLTRYLLPVAPGYAA